MDTTQYAVPDLGGKGHSRLRPRITLGFSSRPTRASRANLRSFSGICGDFGGNSVNRADSEHGFVSRRSVNHRRSTPRNAETRRSSLYGDTLDQPVERRLRAQRTGVLRPRSPREFANLDNTFQMTSRSRRGGFGGREASDLENPKQQIPRTSSIYRGIPSFYANARFTAQVRSPIGHFERRRA